ncbi:hypothetical protein GCM10023238_39990 [Streptomyces heliomycini]
MVGPALLILSELVANSVRHAAEVSPRTTVVYAASPTAWCFAVHDRHLTGRGCPGRTAPDRAAWPRSSN